MQPNLFHVKLSDLVIRDNVRQTDGLDIPSLETLAESIKLYGVIQPINVHKVAGRYQVIAGHRRVLAATLAGLDTIPALVTNAPINERSARQLAENIHRTNLSLLDAANAIRELYDTHASVAIVTQIVGRSKSWVSKHLAITADADTPTARKLIASGHVTDLEIAHLLAQLEKAGRPDMELLGDRVKSGQHNRASLRRLLADTRDAATDTANDNNGDAPAITTPDALRAALAHLVDLVYDITDTEEWSPPHKVSAIRGHAAACKTLLEH